MLRVGVNDLRDAYCSWCQREHRHKSTNTDAATASKRSVCVTCTKVRIMTQKASVSPTGPQISCFTSTKVQTLTPEELGASANSPREPTLLAWTTARQVLKLLALLAQKYKY
jgi:hypothetical protein